MNQSIALVLASSLLGSACGRSSADKNEASAAASTSLVPSGFQNTVSAADFQAKNQAVVGMVQNIEQQFGVKLQNPAEHGGAQVLTQSALQSFVGAKADASLLSRSLEIETSVALVTRLLTDKPSSCTAAVASLETLYSALTIAASEAIAHTDLQQLEKSAAQHGLTLTQQPTQAEEALAFRLTGTLQTPGQTVNQQLNIAAGANEEQLFIKKDTTLAGTLTNVSKNGETPVEYGHYNYQASSGLSADLVQQQLLLIDQRKADLDMVRNGAGVRGISQLDIHNRVQGGMQPAVTSELTLDVQGQGLVDEVGLPLYSERRVITSQLIKEDDNSLRFTLSLASQGVKGNRELAVQWLLQKNAKGECSVARLER